MFDQWTCYVDAIFETKVRGTVAGVFKQSQYCDYRWKQLLNGSEQADNRGRLEWISICIR